MCLPERLQVLRSTQKEHQQQHLSVSSSTAALRYATSSPWRPPFSLPSHTRTPYQRPQLSLLECVCLVPDSVHSSPSDIQCRRHRRFVAVVLPLTSSSAILVLLSIHPVCVYRFPFSRIAQWQSGGVIIIYIYLRMTTMYTPACANVDKKDPRSVESIGKVGALLLVVVGGKVGRSAPCLADLSIFLRSLPYPHSPRVRSASHSCKEYY